MLHNYIKKASTLAISTLLCCMLLLPTSASAQKKKEVVIKAGTPVEVVTTTEISSKRHPLGTIIDLRVVEPVIVSNEVVIPEGSAVKGKVTQSQKSKLFGGKGIIAIEASTLTAVDGTPVPVSGLTFYNEGKSNLGWSIVGTVCCLFGFLIHGTQGVIPADTRLSGNVISNTTILLESAGE